MCVLSNFNLILVLSSSLYLDHLLILPESADVQFNGPHSPVTFPYADCAIARTLTQRIVNGTRPDKSAVNIRYKIIIFTMNKTIFIIESCILVTELRLLKTLIGDEQLVSEACSTTHTS